MEDKFLDVPENQTQYEYAGFWIRFVAALIDGIILSMASGVLMLLLGSDSVLANVIGMGIGIAYAVYFETGPSQATLGKQLMNIYIVDENYQKIDSGKSIGRYFAKILSAIILLIGYIMAGFDSKKQALHDKIVKTYVVVGKPQPNY
jgi:uncharacterized RDD family membrane protein YckC